MLTVVFFALEGDFVTFLAAFFATVFLTEVFLAAFFTVVFFVDFFADFLLAKPNMPVPNGHFKNGNQYHQMVIYDSPLTS
ncbi:MAG: hypothetical protein AAF549_05935 [Pseudomonadota bacterium]